MPLVALCFLLNAQGAFAAGGSPLLKLLKINGRDVLYPSVSPTDGDILDRSLLSKAVEFTFGARQGDWLECRSDAGILLGSTHDTTCSGEVQEETWRCFFLVIDTRDLPNGPNRLFFSLYETFGQEDGKRLLAEVSVLIHVLNHRLEVQKATADSVIVALRAGVSIPAQVRNWKFVLFAAPSRAPGEDMMFPGPGGRPQSTPVPIPIGGGGAGTERLFPSAPQAVAQWPAGQLDLLFIIHRERLTAIAQSVESRKTFLVAAVFDGTQWDWSSVASVPASAAPSADDRRGK